MNVSNIGEWTSRKRSLGHDRRLARGLDVPVDVATRVINETRVDLDALAARNPDGDPRGIVKRGIDELARASQPNPTADALLEQRLQQLPRRAFTILEHFRAGMKAREIASMMGTQVWLVRLSLAWSYVKLLRKGDCGDDGEPQPIEPPKSQRAA